MLARFVVLSAALVVAIGFAWLACLFFYFILKEFIGLPSWAAILGTVVFALMALQWAWERHWKR